ncbi:polynucleotide kinase 3'-phosphatase isoform X2 [Oratosquilla oratoria]
MTSKQQKIRSKQKQNSEEELKTGKRKMGGREENVIPEKKMAKSCENGEVQDDVWLDLDDGKLIVFTGNGAEPRDKVVGYDMDGTLITTKSGRVFAKDYDDWQLLYAEVPGKLKALLNEGYKIVIFSNQAGIARGKQTAEGIKGKVNAIMKKLGVPMQVFISTGKGQYRKPALGMWHSLCEQFNGGMHIDIKKCTFVGDAAGRYENKKKKDHSCSDRLFAINLDMKFETPEEHFLGAKPAPFNLPDFDPKSVDSSTPQFDPPDTEVPKYKQECAVLVGYPGSGKSFFAATCLASSGYIVANRDTLGSWQKCVGIMNKALKDGENVVIDNTNPDAESRKRYIEAAEKLKIPIRCFVFKCSKEQAQHNNKFRELSGSEHSKVNDMIYNMYKSKYVEPTLEEGFKDIVYVNFVPDFRTKKDEELYKMHLLEK